MLKTYLYIPSDLHEDIKRTARREKQSRAEVIRRALQYGLQTMHLQQNDSGEILLKIAALGDRYQLKGPRDASASVDRLLWDRDWSKNDN
ncbi:MAG: ribbon-helix-helix protein, CopG family [bacterium]|nr:ribbon-helix-helix protein, CopG family [bacterium]